MLDRHHTLSVGFRDQLQVIRRQLPAGVYPLPLASAVPDPLLARLRQVPLLGWLLPARQRLHWGQVATYRVRVEPVPNSLCGRRPCAEALLVDDGP